MVPLTFDMEGWRNAPFPPDVFEVAEDGEPVDITGWSLAMDVRAYGGSPTALISLDTTDSTTNDGLLILSGSAGTFRVQIDQASMQAAWDAAYAAGLCKAGQSARLAYDIRLTHTDGLAEVVAEGVFTINPGVTL